MRSSVTSSAVVLACTVATAALLAAPALALSGGPNGFGYTFKDNASGGPTPAYVALSMTTGATPISLADDAVSGAVNLGFTFQYHGSSFTQLFVSSNGWVTFTSTSNSAPTPPASMPNSAAPNNVIAGYWGNLNPSAPGGKLLTQTLGSAPSRVFVVDYQQVQHGPSNGGDRVSFEIKLFETMNVIEVHYGSMANHAISHLAGIEDSAGTTGLTWQSGSFVPTNQAVGYYPAVPTTSIALSGTAGSNGWYRSAVTVALACAPPNPPTGATCTGTQDAVDGGAFAPYGDTFSVPGDGTHTVQFYSTASTGGVEATKSQSFKVDATAPSVSASPSCSLPGGSGWCRGTVTVTTSASDTTSGLASSSCTLDGDGVACGTVEVSSQGSHTVAISATDLAGNPASASTSFQIDSVAPSASVAQGCSLPGNNGWCRGSVDASGSASDDGSGLASSACTLDGNLVDCSGATESGQGSHSFELSAEDVAGNAASASGSFQIDSLAPDASMALSCSLPGNPGWCRAASLDYAGGSSDATSGVASESCEADGAAAACSGSVSGEGAHSASIAVEDNAGNSASASASENIDSVAPSASVAQGCSLPGNNGWCRGSVDASGSASDDGSGLASSACTLDGNLVDCSGATESGQGSHSFELSAEDVAGNAASASGSFQIDSLAPDASMALSCSLPGNPGWCRAASLDYAGGSSDATSGVASESCEADGAAAACSGSVSGEGAHSASIAVEDNAGNSASASASENIDSVAPSVSPSQDCSAPGDNGWCRGGVSLAVSVLEDNSGLGSLLCTLDGASAPCDASVDSEGPHSFEAEATDTAGNSAGGSLGFQIDSTRPTLSVLADCPLPGFEGYCRAAVTAEGSATDALSGIATVTCTRDGEPSPCSYVEDGQGAHDFLLIAVDQAGNGADAGAGAQFSIDSVAPTVGIAADCDLPGNDGWCRGTVSVSGTASDGGSGLTFCEVSADSGPGAQGLPCGSVENSAQGAFTGRVVASDAAGNSAEVTTAYKTDSIAPSVVVSGACSLPGDNGWCRGTESLSASAGDGGSGLASLACELDGAAADCSASSEAGQGSHAFSASAEDAAGNTAGAELAFRIDSVAPGVGLSTACDLPGAPGWCRAASYGYTGTASDGGSGLASQACTLDGSPAECSGTVSGEGPHTLAVAATDEAGNGASASLSLAIDSVAPNGEVISPVWAYTAYQATWTARDATSGVGAVEIQEQKLLGLLGDEYGAVCSLPGDGEGLMSGYCARDPDPGQYCYRLSVTDVAGNTFTSLVAALPDVSGKVAMLTTSCTVKLTPSGVPDAAQGLQVAVGTDQATYDPVEALADGVHVTAHVARPDGSPVEGAAVRVRIAPDVPGGEAAGQEAACTTDAAGLCALHAALPDRAAGAYRVQAFASFEGLVGEASTSYRVAPDA
jgi:hypothetical protein